MYYQEEIILIKVLKMAVKDYSNKRYMSIKEHHDDVIDFFNSKVFYDILNLLSINEDDFFESLYRRGRKEVNEI